jgi:GH24 family phage-related lysozyme (muramidase)
MHAGGAPFKRQALARVRNAGARARAEAAIARWKQVIGDGLRSHTDERRATEVDVAVHVLNHMLELGRPESVRIA